MRGKGKSMREERSHMGNFVASSPRRLAVVLAVLAAVLVPAAVAWACNPQPEVGTDKFTYRQGEQMTVTGRYFRGNAAISITSDPAGVSGGATSTSAGTFRTRLAAPSQPGSYTLKARANNGIAARTTFTVAEPSSTGGGGNAPRFSEPTIERSPAGVTIVRREATGVPREATGDSGGSRRDPRPQPARSGSGEQPTTVVLQSAPAPGARTSGGGSLGGSSGGGSGFDGGGSSGGGSGGDSGAGGAASGTENGVLRAPASRVFVDSLAPADRRAGGAGRATTTAADGAAGRGPSERAATGDLWGGFRSGKAPSLIAGGSADDGSGPGASIGLALLGLGLVGLLSALAVAEARRRRALAG